MGFSRHTAFVVAITAIVVVYLPKLFVNKFPIIIDGAVETGFEEVAKVFRDNFESGREPDGSGSAFAVYYQGRKVIDIWGGYADADALQPWRNNSMPIVFSVTKGIVGVCMGMLVDRAHLDYDQKVAYYWPEFAQKGKENVTVSMLLSHQAGLAMTNPPLSIRILKNYEELGRILAGSPPMWEPGTTQGYHAITYGLYASQLLTRVDPKHRTMGQFFQEEIAEPFGIEFYIGLPLELNYRAARWFSATTSLFMTMANSFMDPKSRTMLWEAYVTGEAALTEVFESAGDIFEMDNLRMLNDPEYRAIESPSVSGFGTAEGLAKLFAILANGGENADGKTLLSENVIAQLVTRREFVKDKVLGIPTSFNKGFSFTPFEGHELYGHPGAGGNVAYADMKNQLAIAFVTRFQSAYGFANDPRLLPLQSALYKCIANIEVQ